MAAMSDLAYPEQRPAVEWVATLPAEWITPTERLLLLALALDSFDGHTCAPGRSGVMQLAGIRHVSSFMRARDALAAPNDQRPALLAVDALRGRHTRYRLLRDVRDMQTGDVRDSQTTQPDMSAEVVRDMQTTQGHGELSAEVVRESCPPKLSAEVVRDSQTYPPLPPDHEGGRREEESAHAPAPSGAALTRLTQAVAEVLRRRWDTADVAVNRQARDLLADLLAADWPEPAVLAGVATIGVKPHDQRKLLAAHLTRMLNDETPADYPLAGTQAEQKPRRDLLAEHDQRAVKTFLKWSGADRDALAAALADIEADGYKVAIVWDEDISINVDHPALEQWWWAYWQTGDGQRGELRAVFDCDPSPLTDEQRRALASVGRLEYGKDGTLEDVVANAPTVANLKRLVEVTGTVALAAMRRHTQAEPQPAPDHCDTCRQPLLLKSAGRTTCERCRLSKDNAQ